jgi:drug/metabolite transporter (DMT)-like permease
MRSKLGVYALLALMALLFASNLIIGRGSVHLVEPWTLAFWRWALATLIVLPFTLRAIVEHWDVFRAVTLEIFILGILGMFVCGGLVYVSLHYTTATNATLLYTSSALFIALLDTVYFKSPLTALRAAGLVIGFFGVATIVLQGEPSRLLALDFNVGDIGIAVCAFSWAVYSVMLRRGDLKSLPTLPLFALISAAGTLTLVPPMLYEAIALGGVPTGRDAWLSIVGLAILPSVLAFWIYQIGVREAGPSVTGVFLYLIPVYGVALAAFTLGEAVHVYHAVGLVLVIAGVVLATDSFLKHKSA